MLAQANISQVKTSPAGTWTIASAKSTSGTPYSGTVQIHPMGQIYTMSWLTTIGDYCGLAFVEDGYIFAGCAFDDSYGVTLYKINPDGTLDGKWISPSNQAVISSETAVNGTPGQLEGTYKINGTSLKAGNYQGDGSDRFAATISEHSDRMKTRMLVVEVLPSDGSLRDWSWGMRRRG